MVEVEELGLRIKIRVKIRIGGLELRVGIRVEG